MASQYVGMSHGNLEVATELYISTSESGQSGSFIRQASAPALVPPPAAAQQPAPQQTIVSPNDSNSDGPMKALRGDSLTAESADAVEPEPAIALRDSQQRQSAHLKQQEEFFGRAPSQAASFDPFQNQMPDFCVNANPDIRTFSHAKKAAADEFKKLIINILDQSLTSVNQNRDLWSSNDVAGLVIEHYCLFQVHAHSYAGRKYLKRYPLDAGAESFNLPIIDILDPCTGALIQRSGHVDARALCRILRHHRYEDVSVGTPVGTPQQPSPLPAPSRGAHASVASQSDVESLSDEGDNDMALAIAQSFDDDVLLSLGIEGNIPTSRQSLNISAAMPQSMRPVVHEEIYTTSFTEQFQQERLCVLWRVFVFAFNEPCFRSYKVLVVGDKNCGKTSIIKR